MRNSRPIFLYHTGPHCSYLKYSVRQARIRNPNSEIVLFTDHPEYYGDLKAHNLQIESVSDYYKSAQKFEDVYTHMSTNPQHFELPCFLRWFVIDEFCTKYEVEKYFYLDNDVLLYCDLGDWEEYYEHCVYTVTNVVSWGISFMNDTKWLSKFCEYCLDVYGLRTEVGKFHYCKLESHRADALANNRGDSVCDMTLIELYKKDMFTPPGLVGEMSSILQEPSYGRCGDFDGYEYYAWDHNINQSDLYDMKDGIKHVRWLQKGKKRYPIVKNRFLEDDVILNCLHFQGPAKNLMGSFVDG